MDLESICMTLRGIEPLSPGLESGVMPLYDKICVFLNLFSSTPGLEPGIFRLEVGRINPIMLRGP